MEKWNLRYIMKYNVIMWKLKKIIRKKLGEFMEEERLQKYLAECGVASRRKCEELIQIGKVKVNGSVVTELGTKIIPGKDKVEMDGKIIQKENKVYILLNKPVGYVTTVTDDRERKTVMELLDGVSEKVVPVVRLDMFTSGLLLLSNDGDFIYNIENYKGGFSTATRIKDTKKAVSYIIKYITKELCEVTFHKRRYLPSNNLDLPVKSYGFSDPKDLMELITDIEYTYGMKLSIEHIKTYDVAVDNYSNTISVMEFAMPDKDEVPGQIPDLYKILERIYG